MVLEKEKADINNNNNNLDHSTKNRDYNLLSGDSISYIISTHVLQNHVTVVILIRAGMLYRPGKKK